VVGTLQTSPHLTSTRPTTGVYVAITASQTFEPNCLSDESTGGCYMVVAVMPEKLDGGKFEGGPARSQVSVDILPVCPHASRFWYPQSNPHSNPNTAPS